MGGWGIMCFVWEVWAKVDVCGAHGRLVIGTDVDDNRFAKF